MSTNDERPRNTKKLVMIGAGIVAAILAIGSGVAYAESKEPVTRLRPIVANATNLNSHVQIAGVAQSSAPVLVYPRWGDGWILLTQRTCGSSSTWPQQRALNGGVGLIYGRQYRIDCGITGSTPTSVSAPTQSGWLYPLINSPCGRNFGQPRAGNDGVFGTSDDYRHQGVDIPSSTGTVVRAARGGRVVFAGWNGSAGMQVRIDHGDGWVTKYNHFSYINVIYGQQLTQGMHIGSVGSTGRSTGPHLHAEMWYNGSLRNPTGVLAPAC